MCGIIGVAGGVETTTAQLMAGLSNLEYRGYDSAGIAVTDTDSERVGVCKRAGELDQLRATLEERGPLAGSLGIGHTRWSTHGAPTDANAHPHQDERGRVAVVHNGIIENETALREELIGHGVTFRSETDTEVVPHLIAAELDSGESPEQAFRAAVSRLEGSYALAAVVAGTGAILVAREDSPLVLGIGEEATYLGSDVPAFRAQTDQVIYLHDGEFARIQPTGVEITDADGRTIERAAQTVDWSPEQTGKAGFDHYMLKEIHEQPRALRQCLQGRVDERAGQVALDGLASVRPARVHLLAAGTSYHAAMYGAGLFQQQGIPAHPFYAHEYATAVPPADDALVIGISQSGETADTLNGMREAQRRGAETLAVTNTVGGTLARETDDVLYIRSGPEIGVAATKTFAAQLTALNMLVLAVAAGRESRAAIRALRDLPGKIQTILDESNARDVAAAFEAAPAYFFIGRGLHHPVALEGALKLKEISYEHAEGFPAGELKHGPLALVTEETPVFAMVTGADEATDRTIGNVKEVEARAAPVVTVTDGASDVGRYADHVLTIPESHPRVAPILANVQLQLLAYHVARRLGRSIDKPRNLAKSVTVE
jgi:glucosamine--fructose-6-phosphate aminotransferase (isomerizing)